MKEPNTKSHYEKKFNEVLARLNAEQRRVVEYIEGSVMDIIGSDRTSLFLLVSHTSQL